MDNQNIAYHDLLVFAIHLIPALDRLGLGRIRMGIIETDGDGRDTRSAYTDIEPWESNDAWRIYVSVSAPDRKSVTLTGTGILHDIELYYRNDDSVLYYTASEVVSTFADAYRAHAKAEIAKAKATIAKYAKLSEE